MPGDVEDLIGSSEAARILGVTAREVRRKAADGTLPSYPVEGPAGKLWRFRRTDVEEYIRAREAIAGGGAGGRTDLPAVLPQVRAAEALVAAHDANTREVAALREAVALLTATIRDQADELRAARQEREEAERARPWWRRWWKA